MNRVAKLVEPAPAAEPAGQQLSDGVEPEFDVAAAFRTLLAKNQDRVFNLCYRLCHDFHEAEDLAQAAFMKAWQALPSFRSGSNLFTWLYRIAVNECLSARRSKLRHVAGLRVVFGRRGSAEAQAEPPAAASRKEDSARLEQALAGLDVEYRVAVVLKDIEGLDYATIAEILQVPVGTVKSRIHRGRTLLRSRLGQGAES